MEEGASLKFVGDNVDNKRGVRDIRSDHHGELKHMYSLLAVKARVKPPPVSHFVPHTLVATKSLTFCPLNPISQQSTTTWLCWSVEFCASTSKS